MKHNTHELAGALLDQAASVADGCAPGVVLPYSSSWEWGGPIIERERISLLAERHMKEWLAVVGGSQTYDGFEGDFEVPGSTPLIAAMRAFVRMKLGEEVELP